MASVYNQTVLPVSAVSGVTPNGSTSPPPVLTPLIHNQHQQHIQNPPLPLNIEQHSESTLLPHLLEQQHQQSSNHLASHAATFQLQSAVHRQLFSTGETPPTGYINSINSVKTQQNGAMDNQNSECISARSRTSSSGLHVANGTLLTNFVSNHSGRPSPTASGSSTSGGSHSSAQSLPSHSPALQHHSQLSYCTPVFTAAAATVVGRIDTGGVSEDSVVDVGSSGSLTLLHYPNHHHHHHHHANHHQHQHDSHGLLDISTL
ncbi:MOB kinase activator-like 2 [Teleopsis dalmanni]|uniref:MOB kinase activator-like 2 n=1 Tax=Teleopsis dalmanni TaxID=139649 RepID=UPI0018CE138A|nr:MOB kinase activator-like 2 [Teleopsis dalmanni]